MRAGFSGLLIGGLCVIRFCCGGKILAVLGAGIFCRIN